MQPTQSDERRRIIRAIRHKLILEFIEELKPKIKPFTLFTGASKNDYTRALGFNDGIREVIDILTKKL